jgi:hypothetical protein
MRRVKGAPNVPVEVRAAADRHLAAVDAAAPGLVSGLYLTGSVALGDYRPGRSDIDFIAFTTRPVTDARSVTVLRGVHEGLNLGLHYDGSYVAAAAVPAVPDDEPSLPHTLGGTFYGTSPCHALTPALWAEFARYAVAIRGPSASALGISADPARLEQWLLANLTAYWQRRAEEGIALLSGGDLSAPVSPEAVAWTATGAARLHYTLATGDIASKTAAGRYAIGLFPDYREVVAAALAWRATGDGQFTCADWIACARLSLDIVADATQRWGGPGRSTTA